MADFKVNDGFSIGMSNLDFNFLLSGDPVKSKRDTYVLDFGNGDKITLEGSDFKFNRKHVLIDGEVHSVSATDGGKKAFSFEDFKLSVKDLKEAANTADEADDLSLVLKALSKDDNISGNSLGDLLLGGAGKDTIYGGGGADKLLGGQDADKFVFKSVTDSTLAAMDNIKDFSQTQHDKINLSPLGDFQFVGATGFSASGQAEVGFEKTGKHTIVHVDTNGDGDADMSFQIADKLELTAADFIL